YLSVLRDLLEKKKKTIRAKDKYEQKRKLIRYALGKGFEMEDIGNSINKCED
ncbi:hypothetical protein EZS27_043928, partial [termite gut metagenome]